MRQNQNASLVDAINHGSTVEFVWNNRQSVHFHAIWLRDHCHCENCRNPDNGQRFLDITQIPEDVQVEHVNLDADGHAHLQFSDNAHQSSYSSDRLLDYLDQVRQQSHDRGEQDKTLWDAKCIRQFQTAFEWSKYNRDSHTKQQALNCFRQFGFFILSGTPAQNEQVLRVIESFGFVRETNYGQLFDVKAEVNPNNLAFTNIGLGAHADNPYRDPVPSIQALHCIKNSVDGGDTQLLDGFNAAHILRTENPEHFNTLAQTPVYFCFSDHSAHLRARVPLISTDEQNRITCVRYNNRSIDTLAVAQEQIPAFYAAYRHYADILTRPALNTQFKLAAGDCVVFDNTRIMHARTAFATGGQRHLQGAYSDLDGLYSALCVLNRECV